MKYILVSVKDRAINNYGVIGVVQSRGQAIREFGDQVNNSQNGQLYAHPEDFDMYELGTWDSESGYITPHDEGPVMIARAQDLKTLPAILQAKE